MINIVGRGEQPIERLEGDRVLRDYLEGGGGGKLLSPALRREVVCHAQRTLSVSERRACRVVGQCRATQQYLPTQPKDEDRLRIWIIALAREYGRYGYRRITALLQQEGWRANHML